MDLTVGAGLLLTAGALGITHGIEPDHVAGITALTHEAGDPKLSALVGGCFAAGHAALVVLWIALAYLLFGTTSFPAAFEAFGMLFVGVILSLLGLYLGITGTRKLLHKHGHDHGEGAHAHYHVHLPSSIRPAVSADQDHGNHGAHGHDHGIVEYLKIGTVGALFTLSPPVSMIAFISVAMSESAGTLMVGVVAVYAAAIIATMAAIGGGAGSLFRLSKARGERFHAGSQVVASVLVLAFAIHLLLGVVPGLLA
ncbi:MAG: hypothetical protein ABEJ74_08040 [Haloferacaceae archaeon]